MIRNESYLSNTRTKTGFAFKRVYAGDYSVWLQLYEVIQKYNPETKKFENVSFTAQTFSNWTKI